MEAEWERFHDAWRGSTVAGGNYFGISGGFPGYGPYGGGYGGGYGQGYGGGGYPGYDQGFRGPGGVPGPGFTSPSYGYGSAGPDPRRLDPDAADGYHDGAWRREPNREFFRPIPQAGFEKEYHGPYPPHKPKP